MHLKVFIFFSLPPDCLTFEKVILERRSPRNYFKCKILKQNPFLKKSVKQAIAGAVVVTQLIDCLPSRHESRGFSPQNHRKDTPVTQRSRRSEDQEFKVGAREKPHLVDGSQLLVTPVPGALTPYTGLCQHQAHTGA